MGNLNETRNGKTVQQEPLLRVNNLQTEFVSDMGVVKAVNGVSFEVAPGETVGIVGESGSGKTVTMLSVMQLIESPPGRIVDGEVIFNGTDLLQLSSREMRQIRGGEIAMIFQDPLTSLNPVYTIGDQLFEAIQIHLDLKGEAARAHAAEALAQVGLPDPRAALDAYPHQFSGGMRQRAMIAMAIACRPTLLIADEPTTALDVTIQEQLLQLVESLCADLGMSVIWITHDLGLIAGLADRILVMYAGEIVERGPTMAIFENPRHPYTQGLLASIPRLELPRNIALNAIPGNPPNLARLPAGCRFAPRCRHRIERCLDHPPLLSIDETHDSRCWVNPEERVIQPARPA